MVTEQPAAELPTGSRRIWLSLIGAASFTLALLIRLWGIPTEVWRWRDDAVITLAHAQGWVNTGVPSVSASAERVEGFTAPLQFFFAAALIQFGIDSYALILGVQVALGVFATGFFLTLFMLRVIPSMGWIGAIAANAVIVGTGLLHWSSVGWLLSGMENSLLIPLLAASMAALAWLGPKSRWPSAIAAGLALGLSGITRTEFAIFLIPAFALVLLWLLVGRIQRITGLLILVISLTVIASLHLWRWMVFGNLIPNSATVQGKSQFDWLAVGSAGLMLTLFFINALLISRYSAARNARWLAWGVTAVTLLLVAFLALGQIAPPFIPVDMTQVFVAVIAFGFIAVVMAGVGVGPSSAWWVFALIAPLPLFQGLLLGAARLDPIRVASAALPLMATALGLWLVWLIRSRKTPDDGRMSLAAVAIAGATGGVIALFMAIPASAAGSLCCDVTSYEDLLKMTDQVAADQAIPRAILANPDLGKVTFDGDHVHADLGLLGEPVLALLAQRSPELTGTYIQEIHKPDVVERHGGFSCYYAPWLFSSDYLNTYETIFVGGRGSEVHEQCPDQGNYVVSRRVNTDSYENEIALTRQLASTPESSAGLVRTALASCLFRVTGSGEPWECQRVRRAVQRVAPELRAAGSYEAAVAVFDELSPTPDFDRLLLTTPPNWQHDAARLFEERVNALAMQG